MASTDLCFILFGMNLSFLIWMVSCPRVLHNGVTRMSETHKEMLYYIYIYIYIVLSMYLCLSFYQIVKILYKLTIDVDDCSLYSCYIFRAHAQSEQGPDHLDTLWLNSAQLCCELYMNSKSMGKVTFPLKILKSVSVSKFFIRCCFHFRSLSLCICEFEGLWSYYTITFFLQFHSPYILSK